MQIGSLCKYLVLAAAASLVFGAPTPGHAQLGSGAMNPGAAAGPALPPNSPSAGYAAPGGSGGPGAYSGPGAFGSTGAATSSGAAPVAGAPAAFSGASSVAPAGPYAAPPPAAPGIYAAPVSAPPAMTGVTSAPATGPSTAPPNSGANAASSSGVNVSNLAGASAKLSPQQVNDAMRALGISPSEALQLLQQLASGTISPTEVQSLCAHLAASRLNPAMVQTVAGTIGLSSEQLQQIQGCMPAPGTPAAVSGLPAEAYPVASAAAAAPQPASNGPPSLIEHNYGELDLQLTPSNPNPVSLVQFGYSIFSSSVSSFAPVANVPVGPDYVIGPGDQLNIYTWGRLNQTSTLTVDRDGSIEISGIEPLQVGGLTFEQARKLIEGRVSQISNVSVHVTMGPLRTIQVLVVGAVNQPGSYTISPLSRVSMALIAAGGISKIGTLRQVELRRGNQVIKRIDYYKLLLRGDNTDDVFLQTNDVVFVPPIGPVVGVVGDVQRPAIYELRQGATDLRGAIQLAAGASPFSDTERVQVERVDKRRRLIVLDVPYAELGGRRFTLRDGDLVKVFHMLTLHQEVVQLTGNVRRPGEFQWRPNMKISDLVAAGGGLAPHTAMQYAVLRRVTYPSMRQRVTQVNLSQALLDDPHNRANLMLEPQDELDIFNEDALRQPPVASVTGEVQLPGTYALDPGMRLSDLVYMAGGLKDDADFSRIQIDRTQIVDGSKTRFVRLYANLHKTAGHPLDDPLLMKNDQVYVTVATGWHPPWTVTVSGEVMRPGTYPIHRDERLSTLLLSCGGFTSDAFPRGIVFTRQSVQMVEQQRLQQSVQQLSQGIAQFGMFSQAIDKQQQSTGATLASLQNLLIQAQTQQATGRVVIHVDNLNSLAGSADDVVLQSGDTISIPQVAASVNVLGSVNEPSSIAAKPGWTVRDYLYRAGGPTPYADTDLLMVVKADGAVITQSGLKAAHPFPFSSVISGGVMGLHLQAGDTIYVPANVDTYIKTQYALSVSTIVANAAQTLAIVALMAKNL
jgi:polysaccharide export outer membrane protein